MGCCTSKKNDVEPTEAPVRQRRVHNFCWIVLFIIACFASVWFTIKAYRNNHYSPIYENGVDSWGNICGFEEQNNEYGHIEPEKWPQSSFGYTTYPVLGSLHGETSPGQYNKLDRKNHTKYYNSGMAAHGTTLCLNQCPGGVPLDPEFYDNEDNLKGLAGLYLAGKNGLITNQTWNTVVEQTFGETSSDIETLSSQLKKSLHCETVAIQNGYDDLALCDSAAVLIPTTPIAHVCAPHYKVAMAITAHMLQNQEDSNSQSSRSVSNNETDSTSAEILAEAGNAIVAEKITILKCCVAAIFIAAIVIFIIQIMTKYLIYTVVTAFFLCALAATAAVWMNYAAVAQPEKFGQLNDILCNNNQTISQRSMEINSMIINLESNEILEVNQRISDSFARMCDSENESNSEASTEEVAAAKKKKALIMAIGVSVITSIIMLLICCNCGNIRLAVNLFDEAGTCVFAIPGILFQPIYTMFILLFMMTLCVYQFLFVRQVFVPVVIPSGEENAGEVIWLEKSFFWQHIWVFTFFVTVWVWYFIDGCHQVTLAGAVNNWYWTQSETSLAGRCWARLKCCPGSKAFCDLVKFSLGSVALGSMLVALVATIRVIIKLIQHAGRKAAGGKETKLTKAFFACIQCLLACVQKFLEFINRNGYIGIAIFGYDFCRAAQKCLALKMENAGRALTLMLICRFVLFLGKICSVVGTLFMCKYLLEKEQANSTQAERAGESVTNNENMPLHSMIAIYGVVACFSFWITSVFLSVYDLTLDTIFLCFCEDQQRNNGRDRPYKSSAKLQKFMRENA